MIRLRKIIANLNLKYVIGEILLIFVGISLAIWFNNWNTALKSSQNKKIVIQRVKEEIQTNLGELLKARETNTKTIEGFSAYDKFYGNNTNEVITTPTQMKFLQKEHPSFFIVNDSIKVDDDEFKYTGGTNVDLELAELNEIAWRTSQSLNISNEFSYDCLYELESMYKLQSKVVNGFDQVANVLGNNEDFRFLMRWLNIVDQFDKQLEQDYRKMLKEIEECR